MFKRILQRIFKSAAYTVAGLVILLAVLVGLFRLFLPRLPEYQEEIKSWASDAIGLQVEFDAMDARWGLRGPELKFYGAELIRPSNGTRAVAANEVGVGVSLVRLLADRTLVVDTVTISDTSIELRQFEDSTWRVQGTPVAEILATRPKRDFGRITVIADDINVALIRPGDERPRYFDISRSRRTRQRHSVGGQDRRQGSGCGQRRRSNGGRRGHSPAGNDRSLAARIGDAARFGRRGERAVGPDVRVR